MKPSIFFRIWCFILNRKIVILNSSTGIGDKIYFSYEMKNPITGERCAYVYPFTKTGVKTLYDDGTASSYIERWKYYKNREKN